MKENVGRTDRIARSIVGPGLMWLGYERIEGSGSNTAGMLALISGALLIESAITRVCPINALIGLDTRSERERERDFRALAEAGEEETAAEAERSLH